jgi:hypothetical protein
MKKTFHNVETGEIKEVLMTNDEILQIENFAIEIETVRTERQDAKAALLERLGITADEAKLLLG